jgi:hypothetical protein
MKLVTPEEFKAYDTATHRGAIEGLVGSLALSLPGFYVLHRRWPAYRALTPQLKALGLVLVVAPAVAIQAERRGLQFDREHNW